MSKQSKKYKIFINYYIQNDKWESISNPNLFILPESYVNLNDVKAKTVYDNFPLQNYFSFYLRFFLDDKNRGVKGWVDFPPNATIPVYNNGNVYVKALRLPKGTNINFKNNDVFIKKSNENKNKENLIFLNENNNNNNPNINSNENKNNNSTDNFIIPDSISFGNIGETLKEKNEQNNSNQNQTFKHSSTMQPNQENTFIPNSLNKKKTSNNNMQNPSFNMSQSPNLNNFNMNNQNFINNNNNNQFKSPNPTSQTQQNFTNNDWGDIFSKMNDMNLNNNMNNNNNNNNMNNTSAENNQSQPKINFTLQGVFSSDIPNDNNNNINTQNQQPVHDFTGSKLNEIDKIPDNLDEDEIKNRVNIIINRWIMGVNEKKNLLLLITTLHEVWTHSNLETPPMQKLVNDKTAVRSYYKKAMRELHADKNRDKDFKTRYIAEMLYQILNEANADFL